MLTSPRWTAYDLLLGMALFLFAVKVFSPHAEAVQQPTPPDVNAAWRTAQARIVSRPLPPPRSLRYGTQTDRLEAALRCTGLAEVDRRKACRHGQNDACRAATERRDRVDSALWPRGRPGQFAMSARGQSHGFAEAYAALTDGARKHRWASSELILTRDNAMCRQYLSTYERRLHDIEGRQPS